MRILFRISFLFTFYQYSLQHNLSDTQNALGGLAQFVDRLISEQVSACPFSVINWFRAFSIRIHLPLTYSFMTIGSS